MQPTSNMITAVPTVLPMAAPTLSQTVKTRAPHTRKSLPNPRPTEAPTMSAISDNIPVAAEKTRAPVVRRSIPGVYNGGGFYYH
jgi:hypothetical protein